MKNCMKIYKYPLSKEEVRDLTKDLKTTPIPSAQATKLKRKDLMKNYEDASLKEYL